jgi:hypothetical protein
MAKSMLTDSNGTIDEESAIRVVQVALYSLKHPDYVSLHPFFFNKKKDYL